METSLSIPSPSLRPELSENQCGMETEKELLERPPSLVEREPMWDGNFLEIARSVVWYIELSENQCGMETTIGSLDSLSGIR